MIYEVFRTAISAEEKGYLVAQVPTDPEIEQQSALFFGPECFARANEYANFKNRDIEDILDEGIPN